MFCKLLQYVESENQLLSSQIVKSCEAIQIDMVSETVKKHLRLVSFC